ncbi:MAG: ice-binding family protein [Candidatus Edwardsbacteria bacterium]|nr:ice-binding family protein [Candidatus Edwardsbacteria bacterium]
MSTKTGRRPIIAAITMALAALAMGITNGYSQPVDLGTAGNFAILAKSGISATGTTIINGSIGVSPIAASAITGFDLTMNADSTYSTSSLVTGNVYAANYKEPTPTELTAAVSAMEAAYTNAAGRTPPDQVGLGAGNISGMTLVPGIYKWATGVIINDSLILEGGAEDVWIFQIGTTLNVGSYAVVHLRGSAQPHNIFWQVAGQTTLGTYSQFKGTILDATAIVVMTGATLSGRALAQTAVTLDAVTMPLAIELSEFACQSVSKGITLTWRTASEINNNEWLIERSFGQAEDFLKLASVSAEGSPFGCQYSYTDTLVLPNSTYYYRLGDKDLSGQITWHGPVMAVSGGLALNKLQLMPCRPNPVSGSAIISYVLPRAGNVSLNVYDICGRKVNTLVQGQKQSGVYNIIWRGSDSQGRRLSSGVYFYQLNYEGTSLTRRLVLLR